MLRKVVTMAASRRMLRVVPLICGKHFRYCSSATRPQQTLYNGSVSTESEEPILQRSFKNVMRRVPSPVVVVTTASYQDQILRGMTCGSFTSVSFKPPIVSFCIQHPSHMHELLLQTKHFAINILSKNQAHYATRFAKPADESKDQLQSIPYEEGINGAPILADVAGVLECKLHDVHTVGDHHVWYGEVLKTTELRDEPLLYFARTYRSVGDEVFMTAFEDTTLLFEDWTHAAHLRMAWNYIKEYGREKATPLIKTGIKKYNEQNKDKIVRGYHETLTVFFIHMVADAIKKCDHPDITFEEFIEKQTYLSDKELLNRYYSPHIINSHRAKMMFEPPDKHELP
ncbi:uncharacterized protein [Ptychodera flava]|uniref:uncharacterized protein n=1 Tax=Ptychodera flava TaxID=63121 RepID=UPI00396A02BA